MIALVRSKDSSTEEVFPAGLPSKSLYSVFTYEQCLLASLQNVGCGVLPSVVYSADAPKGSPSQDFICHGIGMIAKNMTMATENDGSVGTDGEHRATAGLIECLLKFLKGEQNTHCALWQSH